MNEQLQQALAALLNKTVAGVEAGTAFLQAEIPEVIQQLLMWKAVSSMLIFALTAMAFIFCIVKLKPWVATFVEYHRGSTLYYNNSGALEAEGRAIMREKAGSLPFCVGWAIAVFISGLIFLLDGLAAGGAALQIWIAPKIYLIEYAASLAK
jgi:hypothetical protein